MLKCLGPINQHSSVISQKYEIQNQNRLKGKGHNNSSSNNNEVNWSRKNINTTLRKHAKVILRRVLATIVAVEKQCITYSEFVFVDLIIRYARFMLLVISSMTFQLYYIFSHYFINSTIFGTKIHGREMRVLCLSTTCVRNIPRFEDVAKHYHKFDVFFDRAS